MMRRISILVINVCSPFLYKPFRTWVGIYLMEFLKHAGVPLRKPLTAVILFGGIQLNDFLNSKGERFVFVLKSLLNDCG
jgi:hypothetical protein